MGEMADLCLEQMFDPMYSDFNENPDAMCWDDDVWFRRARRPVPRHGISIDIDVANIAKELMK